MPCCLRRSILLWLALIMTGASLRAEEPAVEKAHAETWRRFIDDHGVMRDYVGELPTPEDCRLGKPNAIGWWSPIENGPMFTGMYLHAMVERARRSGAASDKEQARKLAQGLLKCASVSDVPGFVARGIGSDGNCHYPLSSDDQMQPWFLGLHAYLHGRNPQQLQNYYRDHLRQVRWRQRRNLTVAEAHTGSSRRPSRAVARC